MIYPPIPPTQKRIRESELEARGWHKYGPEESIARKYLYGLLDNYYFSGYGVRAPAIASFFHSVAVRFVREERSKGTLLWLGRRRGSVEWTGAGLLVTLERLEAQLTAITLHPEFEHFEREGLIGRRAEEEVFEYLTHNYGPVERVPHQRDQVQGFDFIYRHNGESPVRIEVKGRGADQPFECVFLQTWEINPKKMH
jgi:hypothetical protein